MESIDRMSDAIDSEVANEAKAAPDVKALCVAAMASISALISAVGGESTEEQVEDTVEEDEGEEPEPDAPAEPDPEPEPEPEKEDKE